MLKGSKKQTVIAELCIWQPVSPMSGKAPISVIFTADSSAAHYVWSYSKECDFWKVTIRLRHLNHWQTSSVFKSKATQSMPNCIKALYWKRFYDFQESQVAQTSQWILYLFKRLTHQCYINVLFFFVNKSKTLYWYSSIESQVAPIHQWILYV